MEDETTVKDGVDLEKSSLNGKNWPCLRSVLPSTFLVSIQISGKIISDLVLLSFFSKKKMVMACLMKWL